GHGDERGDDALQRQAISLDCRTPVHPPPSFRSGGGIIAWAERAGIKWDRYECLLRVHVGQQSLVRNPKRCHRTRPTWVENCHAGIQLPRQLSARTCHLRLPTDWSGGIGQRRWPLLEAIPIKANAIESAFFGSPHEQEGRAVHD